MSSLLIDKTIGLAELCNNKIDDDGDGLIDFFDPDCPCTEIAFQAQCEQECEQIIDYEIGLKLKWKTVVLNDSENYGLDNIMADEEYIYYSTHYNLDTLVVNSLVLLDPMSGGVVATHPVDTTSFPASREGGMFRNEIGLKHYFRKSIIADFICISTSGEILWKIEGLNDWYRLRYPKTCDFENSGTVQIYTGNYILNGETGAILFKGSSSEGCNFGGISNTFLPCSRGGNSIAADFTNHPGLELACGNVVYEITLDNLTDSIGNTANVIHAPSEVLEGFSAMADFNADGWLDVISSRSNGRDDGGIWIWDPRTQTTIASIIHAPGVGNRGGIPVVADVNGDCLPEIFITYEDDLRVYSYDGFTDLILLYNIPIQESSGYTIPTIFDLNGDNQMELIFRDELRLFICDAESGTKYDSISIISGTANEQPIITDVDDDGHAEIIIQGSDDHPDSLRLFCFESATTPWAPARKVWNQSGYHVTNVNDDLTIPRYQQNPAAFFDTDSCALETCPQVYNTFGVQATYRTQEGCLQFPIDGDLSISASTTCIGDSFEICVFLEGADSLILQGGFPGWCGTTPEHIYFQGEEIIIDTFYLKDTFCFMVPDYVLWDTIFITINDPNHPFPLDTSGFYFTECDYTNNTITLIENVASLTLDLGPDIEKCNSEVITLNAGPDFESYLWNDLTMETTYSSSDEGLHFVETTDICGNIYRDTVQITFDPIYDINVLIGSNPYCTGENPTVETIGSFDSIQWQPSSFVDCPSCAITQIIVDTNTMLYVIGYKDDCITSDSVLLQIKSSIEINLNDQICSGDSVEFYGSYLTESGSYSHSINICDTIIELELVVTPPFQGSDNQNICEGDSVEVEGDFYKVGSFSIVLSTPVGCDSILSLTVSEILKDSLELIQNICSGDSVLFNGTWYKSEGRYEHLTLNTLGCDSSTFLNLGVADSILNSDTLLICEGDSIQVFGTFIKTEMTISDQFVSVAGCDSTQTYFIKVTDLSSDEIYASICSGDSLLIRDNWFSEAGIYTLQKQNIQSCDSIFYIEIEERFLATTFDTMQICEGDTINIFGFEIFEEASVESTLLGSNDCDSTSHIHVLVSQFIEQEETIYKCEGDSLLINGYWIIEEGMYQDTVPFQDCSAVITKTVIDHNIYNTISKLILCPNDSIQINGQWIYNSENIDVQYSDQFGCDSTHTFEIEMINIPEDPSSILDCESESLEVSFVDLNGWSVLWDNGDTNQSTTYSEQELAMATLFNGTCTLSYQVDLPSIPNLNDIDLPNDTLISSLDPIDYHLNLEKEDWDIQWLPSDIVDCDTCATVELSPTEAVEVFISLTHESGCIFEHSFNIGLRVQDIVITPNIFSPNGDGQNDFWTVTTNSNIEIINCSIYDRWGGLVYSSEGKTSVSWDGKLNGQAVSDGVYVFLISITNDNGIESTIAGDLTVVK